MGNELAESSLDLTTKSASETADATADAEELVEEEEEDAEEEDAEEEDAEEEDAEKEDAEEDDEEEEEAFISSISASYLPSISMGAA